MTVIVPFDGSDLSAMALVRAAQCDKVLEEGVIAASIVPANNGKYAREHGWLDNDAGFDSETAGEAREGNRHDA